MPHLCQKLYMLGNKYNFSLKINSAFLWLKWPSTQFLQTKALRLSFDFPLSSTAYSSPSSLTVLLWIGLLIYIFTLDSLHCPRPMPFSISITETSSFYTLTFLDAVLPNFYPQLLLWKACSFVSLQTSSCLSNPISGHIPLLCTFCTSWIILSHLGLWILPKRYSPYMLPKLFLLIFQNCI